MHCCILHTTQHNNTEEEKKKKDRGRPPQPSHLVGKESDFLCSFLPSQNHRPPVPPISFDSLIIITLLKTLKPPYESHAFHHSIPLFSSILFYLIFSPHTSPSLPIPPKMVSLSTNPFLHLTAQKASPSTRFPPTTNKAIPLHHNNKHSNKDHRKVVCACIAPPRNFNSQDSSAIKFNGSSKSEQLSSTVRDHEDDSDVLIECRDVYKSFGEKKILNGVSFKIRHGEAVGIIGPSGTGKSTILKIIAGLLAPDKGEVSIRGRKRGGLISDDEISGLRIGLVFQSAALFDSLTVRENVGFLLYEHSSMSEERISELVKETLAAVGLKGVEDRLPSELSGGMKKRVALARSIINDTTKDSIEPEVLLYDEPTAGLDPIASTVVEDLIRSVHIKGRDALGKPGNITSYVVVTHQHSTIKRAIDRLLFLHQGKVVWEGMTHEFTTSMTPIVQQFASGSLDGPIKY